MSISKDTGVKVSKPSIPEPPKVEPLKKIEGWVVQVGSFSDQKNADSLASRLKKANFTAFVEKIDGAKGIAYRVRVGPELSKEKADAINEKIRTTQKIPNAIVVKYP